MKKDKSDTGSQEKELIQPNARDTLFESLKEMREETRAEQEERDRQQGREKESGKLELYQERCERSFIRLCKKYYAISKVQVERLGEPEFRELERDVLKRAKRGARYAQFWFWTMALVPLFGQFFAASIWGDICREEQRPGYAWTYERIRKKLEKIHGKDYSLYKYFHP